MSATPIAMATGTTAAVMAQIVSISKDAKPLRSIVFSCLPTGGLIGAGHHLLLVAPSKRSTSRWRQEERASRASNARIS